MSMPIASWKGMKMSSKSDENEKMKVNLAYNIVFIESFWKEIRGLGNNCVSYRDENSIYWTLQKSKESLRSMKLGEADITKARHIKWASDVEKRTGISRDFLIGKKRIRIGEVTDKELDAMFDVFIDACYHIDEINGKSTKRNMGFAKSKLVEYIKSSSKSEKEEIKAIVMEAKDAVSAIVNYKNTLKKELNSLIKNGFGSITDKDSYRTVYFVVNNKPASFAATTTASDLIELLENITAKHLSKLGENNLLRMKAALEKDLGLVNAVLTIGDEIKEFK